MPGYFICGIEVFRFLKNLKKRNVYMSELAHVSALVWNMEARRLEEEHENYQFNLILYRTRLAFSAAFIVDYENIYVWLGIYRIFCDHILLTF
jgi:hypothetical protein